MYQNKLQEEGVQDVVHINKMKFELYGDLVDQAFSQFNENLINNQDPHSQIESDSEKEKTNKTSALPSFMPQILPDDEIAVGINALNSKQSRIQSRIFVIYMNN